MLKKAALLVGCLLFMQIYVSTAEAQLLGILGRTAVRGAAGRSVIGSAARIPRIPYARPPYRPGRVFRGYPRFPVYPRYIEAPDRRERRMPTYTMPRYRMSDYYPAYRGRVFRESFDTILEITAGNRSG